jgi:hypothetical protein
MNKQTATYAVVGVIWLGLSADCAQAGLFGTNEKIRTIELTRDPNYTLCHKVRMYFFFAGVYVADDGYVLKKTLEFDGKYYPLDDAKIRELQKEGILPVPLPPYSLSFLDYLFGYSLWIILAFTIVISLVRWRWKSPTERTWRSLVASREQAGMDDGHSSALGPTQDEKQ